MTLLYRSRLAGLVRGSEHSASSRAMKPMSGSASPASIKLVHLIEAGEVVNRLGRGVAELFHRPVQIRHGFLDGNQAVPFARHAFFSHVPRIEGARVQRRGG